MRNTPYTFMQNNEPATEPDAPATEPAAPKTETPAPDQPTAPEKPFFEKYKTLLLIALAVAVIVFFWKFKIVSKASLAVASAV